VERDFAMHQGVLLTFLASGVDLLVNQLALYLLMTLLGQSSDRQNRRDWHYVFLESHRAPELHFSQAARGVFLKNTRQRRSKPSSPV
jgi:hypothetical protein